MCTELSEQAVLTQIVQDREEVVLNGEKGKVDNIGVVEGISTSRASQVGGK